MRFELWTVDPSERLLAFAEFEHAATYLRSYLAISPPGTVNTLLLVDRGTAGTVMTYPLEGAPLLALVFGLEQEADA